MTNLFEDLKLHPSDDRGHLLTEQVNPKSECLDQLTTESLVTLFCEEDREPQRAVAAAIPELIQAVEAITDRLRSGGRLL